MNFFYNTPIKINIPHIPFRSSSAITQPQIKPAKDGFITNPIYEHFGSQSEIEGIAKTNPRIRQILTEYNLPLQVNIEELEKLKNGHLKDTRIIAAKIYSALPQDLKKEVSLSHLQEAAILHDYGKVLIPNSILNKAGKLNPKEREIMELHSELGYELLKAKGISEKTLELVKYHHQNLNRTGYPYMPKDIDFSTEMQILVVADKYAALREKRCYKTPLGKMDALGIIANDVNKGIISQDVYTALIKSV